MSPLSLAPRALADIRAPSPRPGIWKIAALVVALIFIASTLVATAIVTGLLTGANDIAQLPAPAGPTTYQITTVVEQSPRKVYPYSILPGGAETLDEAKHVLADAKVKAGCPGIDIDNLRQVKLRKNLTGHVSYRVGNRIYWTANVVTLRPGEIVFTDGIRLIRGRGLNCYSPLPMQPTLADEPTEQVLDTPTELPVISYSFAKVPAQMPNLPPTPDELTPSFPFLPAANLPPDTPLIPPIRGRAPAPPGIVVTQAPRSR